jgi:hypothetical protein
LGGVNESVREIPSRSLPYGSEGIKQSPTYVAQSPVSGNSSVKSLEDSTPRAVQQPHFDGPPVLHEKGETYATKATPEPATEEELDAMNN